ncbi:GNAT family N-acetyltransferase [Azospirillum sp. TSO35-2]|uniref:GNAT family N-acetyltransferase n=1 Tax=Azospirillum sp. TSO35-2 TaxID=716796 RepID=UPI000D61985B|nr:GNAT family N-acetyltransferase [Azospirillum sp. TSO35-2]PWC39664.1 GNAT family acetyltransferase [Azospirillum sp. TSO35-2]
MAEDPSFSLTRPALPAASKPGHLSVIVTYLEMTAPPAHAPLTRPKGDLALVRANPPTWSFYRYLYDTVGEPWLWHERRRLPRKELERSILDPLVEVWVLQVDGTPAGFFELDRRTRETDLAYFGLIPDFIGHKLGPWLLDSAIRRAWDGGARKLVVNTCSFDHPKALPLYQSMGFVPTRHVVREIRDPRIGGPLPRSAGTHIPIVE